VRLGSVNQVVGFLNSGLSADILNSALLTACLHGHSDIVRKLLEYGAHVESYNEPSTENQWIGGSALKTAASRHHYRVVDILLDAGSAVNGTRGGITALLGAIRNQQGYYSANYEGTSPGSNDSVITTVDVLLRRGADPNTRDINGTALGYCVGFSGTPLKVLDLLVQFGADTHDRSVLCRACGKYTTTKYLEWLEKQGVSFSATDDDSEPPFIEAVKSGKAKKVKFFLDREGAADLEWTDDSGHDVVGMLAAGCVHLYRETAEVIECIMDSPRGKALDQACWKKAVDIAVASSRMRKDTDSPQVRRILDLLRRAATGRHQEELVI
jgi:ankyrin repeat protein